MTNVVVFMPRLIIEPPRDDDKLWALRVAGFNVICVKDSEAKIKEAFDRVVTGVDQIRLCEGVPSHPLKVFRKPHWAYV